MRRAYLDWARGLAVLVMIEAHTLDAWTRLADRSTPAFRYLTLIGGFAAPLFLWLAGLGLALSAESRRRKSNSRAAAVSHVLSRGLEVFVLAFLFRLQAFLVTPGSSALTLFRVDILNIMGLSVAFAGLFWGVLRRPWALVAGFAVASTTAAMATPVVRESALVNALPVILQWYLRPAGEFTTFTLLPWAGFVFAGAAAGALLARGGSNALPERTVQLALAVAGLFLVGLGFYTASLPSIYGSSSFWTSSPTYFAIRTGVLMLILGACYAVSRLGPGLTTILLPLERLGRGSLLVYWVHVELVYGYATWPLRHRLSVGQAMAGCASFCALMWAVLVVRDRLARGMQRPSKSVKVSVIRT